MLHRHECRSVLFTLMCAVGALACGEEAAVEVTDDAPDFAVRLLPEEGAAGSDAGTVPTWASDDEEDSDDPIAADNASADPEGPLTCNQIFACFSACDDGDQDCIDGCFERGNAVSQNAVSAIGACVRDNACQDNLCVETHCADEVAGCDADDRAATVPPTAPDAPVDAASSPQGDTLTCNEIFNCFGECENGESDCFDACFDRGSERAQEGVVGISECIRDTGCESQECIAENCADPIAFCDSDDRVDGPAPMEPVDPAPVEDLTCNEIYGCFDQCAGDRTCVDVCFEQGSPAGQRGVQDISQCISANACQDEACARFHCADQIAFCDAQDGDASAAPRPGNGPLACVDIFQCTQSCAPGDQLCSRACYDRGSVQGRQEADAVAMCVQRNQCLDDACARALCAAEVQACETADGAAPQPNLPDDVEGDDPEEPALFGRDPLAGDGTCDAPNPLRFGQNRGSTVDAPQILRGECAGGGAEKVFSFSVNAATPVCLDTDGSDFDTVLYVRADACGDAQAELACNDDELGIQSQVALMATPGVTYYVVVDGYNRSGEFVLNMAEGDCL